MTLDYFYGQAGELFSFYRIPKALFQESRFQNLSTDAKTLYGILLDRMSLSAKNGWLDEQGRVFIIFTIEDVKRALCCADNKATKLLRELEEFGLIERKRRGLGKPSLVYLIPANIELAGLEVSLVNCMNREKMLKQVLDSAKREYDFILLDCTPSLGMLTVNALAAADTTLIPVQAQYLSAKGLELLLQTVQKVRRQINPKLKIEGILLTMTDSRTNYGQQIDNLIRGAYGSRIKVFDQTIPRSVRAAEISAVGKSIFQHDPKGKVAEAYCSLTKEVMANAERQLKRVAERGRCTTLMFKLSTPNSGTIDMRNARIICKTFRHSGTRQKKTCWH